MRADRWTRVLWGIPFLAAGPAAALAPRSLVTLLVGGGLLAIAYAIAQGRQLRPSRMIALPIGLLVAYAGLSASWSLSPGSGASQFFKLLYLLAPALLAGAALLYAPPEAKLWAGWGLAAGAMLGMAIMLADSAAGRPLLGAVHGTTESGTVGDPAANRTLVALATLIWPAALALRRIAGRLLALAMPIIYLFLSMTTTSQTTTVGMAAGLIGFSLACVSLRMTRWLAIGVLVLGFGAIVPVSQLAYSGGLSEAQAIPYSGRHRFEIWHFAAERIVHRPLFGYGLDSSRAMQNDDQVSKFEHVTGRVIPLHPHSIFLQVWMELGAVGAALAFAVGAGLLWSTTRFDAASQSFILAAFLSNLAMASVTSFSMWQVWWTSALIGSALCLMPSLRRIEPAPSKNARITAAS